MILVGGRAESGGSKGAAGCEDPSRWCKEAVTRKGRAGKQARVQVPTGIFGETSLTPHSQA